MGVSKYKKKQVAAHGNTEEECYVAVVNLKSLKCLCRSVIFWATKQSLCLIYQKLLRCQAHGKSGQAFGYGPVLEALMEPRNRHF